MKAIERIKTQILAKFTFTIKTNNDLPCLSWIDEKTKEFRKLANDSRNRMITSGLFTKDECREIAEFAAAAIEEAAKNARETLRQMKRERFVF